jgi:hypothetical protein
MASFSSANLKIRAENVKIPVGALVVSMNSLKP